MTKSNIFNLLIDAIFPPKCLKCGSFLFEKYPNKNYSQVSLLSQYFCSACFKVGENSNLDNPSKYCQIELIASSKYSGIIKESIHLLKYNGKTQLADPLGFILFNTFIQYYGNKSTDLIVPIPLYYWKMVKRGFNQSFLLVRNFKTYWFNLKGSKPAWQIAPDILIRERDTKSQTGFNKEERKNNVKGAFAVRKSDILKNRIKGKNIVLVDDVYTTGATAIEACNTLLEAGAESVKIVVLAKV